ncbi:vitamin D3 receptor A-like isoform X2 [Varroa destructor]|uniref:Uncharacterized protein n=1 Tax=Varroa destructor TaxID=109461 RepID=A0A7M7K4P0_VARDE|nr:vitamin D3 receptor A-like isoform X2 [Varroa destructor]
MYRTDERCRSLGLWNMMLPFQAVSPSHGFSPLAVSSLKIGDLPSAVPGFGGNGGLYHSITPSLTPSYCSTTTNNSSSTKTSDAIIRGTNPLSPLLKSPLSSPTSPRRVGSGLDRVLPVGASGSLGSLAINTCQWGQPTASQISPGSTGSFVRSRSHSSLIDLREAKLLPFRSFPASPHGSRTPSPSTTTAPGHHGGSCSPLPMGKKPAKVCGVCGDRAKSYHFGGISCDSCKAFFRRSVQNEAYKNFQCPYEAKCDITIASRKCCQFCRFRKCNDIGMEKGWVMTELERSQLLKSRLERKQRLLAVKTVGSASATGYTPENSSGFTGSGTAFDLGSCPGLGSQLTTATSSTNPISITEAAEGFTRITDSPSTTVGSLSTGLDSTTSLLATSVSGSPRSSSCPPVSLAVSPSVAYSATASDLTPEDIALIEELINCHLRCCPASLLEATSAAGGCSESVSISGGTPASEGGSLHEPLSTGHLVTRSYVLQLFFSAIRQFSCFAQQLASFQVIPIAADRETLLRASVLEMLFLRSAFAYDARLKGWVVSHEASRRTDEALVYFEDVRELVDDERLLEKHKRFMKGMQASMPEKDHVVYTILMAICLHCGDRKGLLNCGYIVEQQERYILLLQRYLQFRYKPTIGKTIYARILLKLADLREVAESHQEFDLKLTEKEIREIQERLAQQTFSTNSDGSSDLPSQWRFHEHITSKDVDGDEEHQR